jgi:hypothetical protein
MTMLLRRMRAGNITVHGFRSSFRDWAGECTSFPREIAEAALAHVVGDETERAYRRGDALEKRRKLMEAWSGYLAPKERDIVVQFSGVSRTSRVLNSPHCPVTRWSDSITAGSRKMMPGEDPHHARIYLHNKVFLH